MQFAEALLVLALLLLPAVTAAAAPAGPPQEGLCLWLDASDAKSVVADGDGGVSEWRDRSPAGRVATAKGTGKARLVPGAMNGKPAVRFDGAVGFTVPPTRERKGNVALFVVTQRLPEQASETKWQRLISCSDGVNPDNKGAGFCLWVGDQGSGDAYGPTIYDRARGDVPILELGVGMNVGGGQWLRGDIAEVLLYDRGFLAEDDTLVVINYLRAKWGAQRNRSSSGWTRLGPLETPPKRTTDRFPLSDQENKSGWEPYAPMTDEFGAAELDKAKWHTGIGTWLGRQPALHWAGNVSVRDGGLHLVMRKEEAPNMPREKGYHTYTSAGVQSNVKVCYGYFEIRARAMRSAGSSAFWFSGSDEQTRTEIDVFEIGGGAPGFERKYNMNAHVFYTPTDKTHWSSGGVWMAPWNLADDYHVYGLEWDEKWLSYFVDGVLVRKMENTHWHQPLALDFDSETMPTWFGMPEEKDLPSTFSIDYVRAWKRK